MGSRRWGEEVLSCLSLLSSSPDLPFPTTMESSSGWCSTCFASKCRCSSTSRGEDQSHHGARANQQGKHQGGFSEVQETSFSIQSCSYQAARGHHQPIFQVSAKESSCLEKRIFVNCFTITRGWGGELHFVDILMYKYKL